MSCRKSIGTMRRTNWADVRAAIGAAVGPGRSFVILVKEDNAPTADVAGSARNDEDVRQIRRCVEALIWVVIDRLHVGLQRLR